MSNFKTDTEYGFSIIENLYIDTLIVSVAPIPDIANPGGGGDRGPQNTKFEKSPKTRLGNCIRKVHAKFGQASSIRNDRKVGGTKSLNNQKKIHFWLQNGHF